jgi:hypothetical protein
VPSSVVYDSFMSGLVGSPPAISPATDLVKLMLVNGYVPNQSTDATRADVPDETTGTGYTAGGNPATVLTSLNTALHVENIALSPVVWEGENTFTTTGAVLYKSNGGPPSGDPLYCYIDFGGPVSCAATTFTVVPTGPLQLSNNA